MAFSLLDVFIGSFIYQRWRMEAMCAFFGSQDDLGDLQRERRLREREREKEKGYV